MMTEVSTELNGQSIPVASASEAFQNHEDRLQWLERVADYLREAFPQFESGLGKPRLPHMFTADETTGHTGPFAGTDAAIAGLQAENAELKAMVSQILDRLPGLPPPSLPPDPNPGPPAGAGPAGPSGSVRSTESPTRPDGGPPWTNAMGSAS